MKVIKNKAVLIASLSLNGLLILYIIGGFIVASQVTDYSMYSAMRDKLCQQDYQKTLNDYDKQFISDPQMAADAKNSFAINVCQRNYKTGQPLTYDPSLIK